MKTIFIAAVLIALIGAGFGGATWYVFSVTMNQIAYQR